MSGACVGMTKVSPGTVSGNGRTREMLSHVTVAGVWEGEGGTCNGLGSLVWQGVDVTCDSFWGYMHTRIHTCIDHSVIHTHTHTYMHVK